MNNQRIGFLHPGAMGVSLAASAISGGHEACWSSSGRSAQTRERARANGLCDLKSVGAMCDRCAVIVSICPPSAADELADEVLASGFAGVYVDANAISPMRARSIAARVGDAGGRYVDASVIGGPAWTPGETVLYLSGPDALLVSGCFGAGVLATRVIGDEIDRASALKMCYAAYTKGTTAMLCAIVGAARRLGVEGALTAQWELDEAGSGERTLGRVRRVTAKAWRYEGEMLEIAATLEEAGVPGGFHTAAAEVYARLARFKGRDATPGLDEIIARVLSA